MVQAAAGLLLLALIVLPVIAGILTIIVINYGRRKHKPMASIGLLVAYNFGYALLMSALAIGLTIWYMFHYETTTGYSAGNAPAGLIFLLPVAIGSGQLLALLHWWYGKAE